MHLNETANVTDQMNPFLTIMLHQIKKGLHQKNRKEDVSSRPHILFFLSLDFIFLFFQRFNLLLRRNAKTFQAFHSSHHISCSVVKLLLCLVEGSGQTGYQIADSCKGIFEASHLVIQVSSRLHNFLHILVLSVILPEIIGKLECHEEIAW